MIGLELPILTNTACRASGTGDYYGIGFGALDPDARASLVRTPAIPLGPRPGEDFYEQLESALPFSLGALVVLRLCYNPTHIGGPAHLRRSSQPRVERALGVAIVPPLAEHIVYTGKFAPMNDGGGEGSVHPHGTVPLSPVLALPRKPDQRLRTHELVATHESASDFLLYVALGISDQLLIRGEQPPTTDNLTDQI